MSANEYGIIAWTGRAHCQRQVAFFKDFDRTTKMLCLALVVPLTFLSVPVKTPVLHHNYFNIYHLYYPRLNGDCLWWSNYPVFDFKMELTSVATSIFLGQPSRA